LASRVEALDENAAPCHRRRQRFEYWAADRVESGSMPEWVSQEAMNYLKQRVNGHGGIILLDARGRFGIAHNTPRMAWAIWTTEKQEAGIQRNANPEWDL